MLLGQGPPRGRAEEGRKMVLIQTSGVEENAPLKAKNGVRLNYAQRRGNVAEERPLVLVYQETNCPHPNSQCRGNTPLKAKNGVLLNYTQRKGNVAEERPLVLVYQETILTFKEIAWKTDDQEMVKKAKSLTP